MRRCSDGRPRRRPRVAVPSRHRLSRSAGRGNPQACRACGAGPPPGGPRSQCEAYGRCPRPAGVSCGTPAPAAPWRNRWLGGVWVPPLSVPLGVARLAHPRPRGPGSTRLDDPRWSRCRPGFREGRAPGGTRSRPVVPGSGKLAPAWHRGRGPPLRTLPRPSGTRRPMRGRVLCAPGGWTVCWSCPVRTPPGRAALSAHGNTPGAQFGHYAGSVAGLPAGEQAPPWVVPITA